MTSGPTATRPGRVRCATALAWVLCCLPAVHAFGAAPETDPIPELRRLSSEGHADRVLARLPALMAARPDDPRLPFEKALALSSQRRVAEAIAVYERMVKTWPGLPEPLNNLGVLYAASGDLDRARTAFDAALNVELAARTAYANLNQVNMRVAGRAYAKALRIDDGPKVLALAPIERLAETASAPAPAAASVPDAIVAALPPPTAPVTAHRDAPLPTATVREAPAAASATRAASESVGAARPPTAPMRTATAAPTPQPTPASRPTITPVPPPVATAAKPTTPPPEAIESRDVQAAIAAWASAWSQKNVDGYFAAYVPGYKGSDASAAAWQAGRRVRILGKSRIAVGVSRVVVVPAKDGSASASFRQTYVADQLNVSSSKTLEFVRQGGKWLIRRELAGS